MNAQIRLNAYDLAIFGAYLVATLLVGFYVARREKRTSKDYFLAGRKLPWYVVGASLVATVISTEHFIGSVGAAYAVGMVLADFHWNAWIVYTLLIWIFLPYYFRTGLYTMPEFLERRYNSLLRYLYTVCLVIGYVASLIGAVLFAGGEALESMFGWNIYWSIVILAAATGAYTIYGGLTSVAWTDVLQLILLLVAGIVVAVAGLWKVGGLVQLAHEYPSKFQAFLPPTHKLFPATGVFTGFLSVGIWYNCASQHTVQRCLAAKSEWNARMGVIAAGFLHVLMPLLVVVPGIVAFKLFPKLDRPDHAYPMLVKYLIPPGLRGLIMAGLVAALMGHLSSVINSTSTIVTLDLYKRLWNKEASEAGQVRFGQYAGVLTLVAGTMLAFYYSSLQGSFAFLLIQNVFAYIAPPFAVVFTLGILWSRANGTAAVTTILAGFPFTYFIEHYLFPHVKLLQPYDNYLHRALLAWAFCMVVMVVVSLLTPGPDKAQMKSIIWKPRYSLLPEEEQRRYGGWKDFRFWWLLFVATVLSIYGFFLWFRLKYG
ncbi:MAG TPA: sodium/solute symporter [Acidobacteriota bacterium]|jgi:SSS family solute:Na+ symporter|nr:sodium/solute symporter [Acidobacteriota bacterium]